MKPIPTFLLAAAAFLPQALADTTPTDAADTPPAAVEQVTSLVREMMATMGALSAILDKVTDTASADAAAPELAPLAEKLLAIVETGKAMDEPPIDGNPQLEALEEELEAATLHFTEKLIELDMHDFYGSEAITEALAPVL